MRKIWTQNEDKILIELTKFYTRNEIALKMGFSLSSVKEHTKLLNIDFPIKSIYKYTEDEKTKIIYYMEQNVTIKEISKIINRSEHSIHVFCSKNKILSNLQPKTWTTEENDLLNKLKTESPDLTSKEIGILMERSEGFINIKLKENNLNSNKSKTLSLARNISPDNLKQCYICKNILNISNFYKNQRRTKSECKNCSLERSKLKLDQLSKNESLIIFLRYKLSAAKSRAKKYSMDFNLDIDHLCELYYKQSGKCFYTDQLMTLNTRNYASLSIDRIDSSKGYTKDNIVLCGFKINNMKNDLNTQDFINTCLLIAAKFNP